MQAPKFVVLSEPGKIKFANVLIYIRHSCIQKSRSFPRSFCCLTGYVFVSLFDSVSLIWSERWGAGVETQKNVRGEIGGWGRVPFNEPYAPSLSTIYDGA